MIRPCQIRYRNKIVTIYFTLFILSLLKMSAPLGKQYIKNNQKTHIKNTIERILMRSIVYGDYYIAIKKAYFLCLQFEKLESHPLAGISLFSHLLRAQIDRWRRAVKGRRGSGRCTRYTQRNTIT